MIDAKELRIGNYVLKNNAFICAVKELHKTEAKIRFADDNHDIVIDYEYIKPIPLTEEILLKCGFVENKEYEYWSFDIETLQKEFIIRKGDVMNSWVLCDIDVTVIISSLHQLQNLYFALTGQELNVEL